MDEATKQPRTHEATVPPAEFEAFLSGARRHDVRRSEDILAGDRLLVREAKGAVPTGRTQLLDVTYVTYSGNPCALSPEGLAPGYSILSVEVASP